MNIADSHQESSPLHNIFTVVPPRYDLINRIITLGQDRRWRYLAAKTCLESAPRQILDIGCGTGDMAISIALLTEKNEEITGLDYSPPMLERARDKAKRAGVGNRVNFVLGDAARAPFPDGYFDCVGISFAFRNLTYKNPLRLPHLAEVRRLLRPGGTYVIVESSQPDNRFIRKIFHFYLRVFVATVGTWISGSRAAYHYLAESASRFYSPDEIRALMLSAGFTDISYRPLLFGAVGIHVAVR